MWGYNDKIKYKSDRNLNNKKMKYNLSKEEIIKNKVKIFKEKIYKQFMEKVENEKRNELKRIQILKKIDDPKIRENLETKFAIERGKVESELTKEKERIIKAIKDYEDSLIIKENLN